MKRTSSKPISAPNRAKATEPILQRFIQDGKAAFAAGGDDEIGIVAAGIAFYALLALVPLLATVVLAYGIFADPATVAKHIAALAQTLPQSAAQLIGDQLQRMTEGNDGGKILSLLLALVLSLFSARNGAKSLMTGLAIALNVEDRRGFLRANIVALALTAGAVVGLAVTAGAIAALGFLPARVSGFVSPLVVFLAGMGGSAMLLRYAPCGHPLPWSAIKPAAALFSVLWLVATIGFGIYAANFGSYGATYGSLGAVVILLTWFYLTGYFLLLAAEYAAVRAKASRSDT
ncbi:YihY/virulence factor BrkB family protein [Qipengyuania pelagi]|uniref:YihY/virulence factor BrkB family protein n=1 Tax=Qipengyuania pelagi TaxID=994320 RepID=UPI002FED2AC9